MVICKKQPYTMVVEVENLISQKEVRRVAINVFYKKPSSLIILCAGILCLILACTGFVTFKKEDLVRDCFILFFIVLNLIMPFFLVRGADQQYNSSVILKAPIRYIFDEDKIAYQGNSIEGSYNWDIITRYSEMKNLLLLYFSAQQITFIKTDSLTEEQLNFIKSKIKAK